MALKAYLDSQKKTKVYIPNITCIALPQVALQSDHDVSYYDWNEEVKCFSGSIVIVQAILGVLPEKKIIEDIKNSGAKIVLDLSQAFYIPDEYLNSVDDIDFIFSSFQVNKPYTSSSSWGGVGFFKEKNKGLKKKSIFKELILNLKGVLIDIIPRKYLEEFNNLVLKQDYRLEKVNTYYTERDFLSEMDGTCIQKQTDLNSDLKGIDCGYYFPIFVKDKKSFIASYGHEITIYNWPKTILSPFQGNLDLVNFPIELKEKTQWYADHLLGIVIKNKEDKKWLLANISEVRSKWTISNF